MTLVKGTGPQPAKIMIIGEAPGSEETAQGKPFVGSAGKLLNSALASAGIDREQCYVTNVVKVQPPKNDLERLGEIGCTIEQFLPELEAEILQTNPNIIIALGGTPLQYLTGKDSILKWRGSILDANVIPYKLLFKKVLPAVHPAACLRQWSYYPLLVFDLKKAKAESEFPEVKRIHRDLITATHFDEVIEELDRLQNEAEYISEDLESYKGTGVIRCIGLSDKISHGFSIPFVDAYTPVWNLQEEVEIWNRLSKLLLYSNKKVTVQYASFELKMLEPWLGGLIPLWMDTLKAHSLCYPELPHNLGFLGSVYTDMPYWKDDKDGEGKASDDKVQLKDLMEYNCKDVCGTLEIAFKLEKELQEIGMHEFYHQYEKPLQYALISMEKKGLPVNRETVARLRNERFEKIAQLEQEFKTLAGADLNVKSSKQMQQFLYVDLALPVKYNKKTNKPTTNADALEKLLKKTGNPVLEKIVEIRHLKHDLSSFLFLKEDKKKGFIDEMPFQLGEDNRLHTEYGTAETGRLTSSANVFGQGTNLQNQPEDLRVMFEAPEGKIFVKGDLEQAEDRATAWLAGEKTVKKLYKNNVDTHMFKAAFFLGKDTKDISIALSEHVEHPEELFQSVTKAERSIFKSVAHGWNYGEGARGIAEGSGISTKEVEAILIKLNQMFPNIAAWHLGIQQQLRQGRMLTTPFGRRRIFMGRWDNTLFREAYAFLPQSTVADYTDKALLRMCALLQGIDYIDDVVIKHQEMAKSLIGEAEILHQCHDEILPLVSEEKVGEYIALLKSVVQQPFWCGTDFLTIPVDIKVGKTWGSCKKWN